jgi:hypothetical protein
MYNRITTVSVVIKHNDMEVKFDKKSLERELSLVDWGIHGECSIEILNTTLNESE